MSSLFDFERRIDELRSFLDDEATVEACGRESCLTGLRSCATVVPPDSDSVEVELGIKQGVCRLVEQCREPPRQTLRLHFVLEGGHLHTELTLDHLARGRADDQSSIRGPPCFSSARADAKRTLLRVDSQQPTLAATGQFDLRRIGGQTDSNRTGESPPRSGLTHGRSGEWSNDRPISRWCRSVR